MSQERYLEEWSSAKDREAKRENPNFIFKGEIKKIHGMPIRFNGREGGGKFSITIMEHVSMIDVTSEKDFFIEEGQEIIISKKELTISGSDDSIRLLVLKVGDDGVELRDVSR